MEPRCRCRPLFSRISRVGVLLALIVAGCSADSQDRVEAEVNRLVQTGMPLTTATLALTGAGFTCGSNNLAYIEPADVLCTRERSHRILATCIHRVFIVAGAATVARVTVPPPLCASL